MRARLPTAAVLGLLLSACSGDDAAPSIAAAVDTLNGVERFNYPAQSATDLGWSADTVAVIGDVFGEDAYQFGQVGPNGLAGDADGNLYVLDRQAFRVLKFGPVGEHLETFGRQGAGPGELEQPTDLELGRGDSLWVADFSNSRFTILPQEGGDARSIRFPENTFPMYGFDVQDDDYVIGSRVISMSFGPGAQRDAPPPGVPVLKYDPEGALQDTLWSAPEPRMDRVELSLGNRVMVAMSPRAFAPRLRFDRFADGTLAVNDTAAYLVALVTPDGSVERWIQRGPPPRTTTDADREAERGRIRQEEGAGGGGVAIRVGGGGDAPDRNPLLEQRLQKMTFEAVIPRVVRLAVDPHDRLWVGVSEDTPDEVERIDIYDRGGALLGEVRGIPFPDVFIGTDRFGTLVQDELDVQQVVVYRLSDARMASGA